MAVAPPVPIPSSQSCRFQATRWVLTDDRRSPITWDNVRDFDGITRTKVLRIVLLILPAIVFDLLHMGWMAWFGTRDVRPVAPPAALAEPQPANLYLAPVDEILKGERTEFLLAQVERIVPIAALVIAYLPQKKYLEYPPSEFPMESVFSLSKELKNCVLVAQTKQVDWMSWERIREIPNAQSVFYPQIQGLYFTERANEVSTEQFLAVIKRLPHLKQLTAPIFEERSNETLVEAIKVLQDSLEDFCVSSGMRPQLPGDAMVRQLAECPKLTALTLCVGTTAALVQGPSNASMIALAQQGRLKRLALINVNTINHLAYQAFFNLCPLEHVSIQVLNLFGGQPPPPDLLQTLSTSRGGSLLSLKYDSFNVNDAAFRSLAANCPNLESLDICIRRDQETLFETLFPQWRKLRRFDFSCFSSGPIITRMVNSSPSLQEIDLGSLMPYQLSKWKAFKMLGQLGRPLTIRFFSPQDRLPPGEGNPQELMRKQMKAFPQVQLVESSEEISFTLNQFYA